MRAFLLTLLFSWIVTTIQAELPAEVSNFLNKHCLECHDDLSAKADLDLTLATFADRGRDQYLSWGTLHGRVEESEMPPADKPQPTVKERQDFLRILSDHLASIETEQRESNGRAQVRRLNRLEYQHTLQDILSLPGLDIADSLPPEGSAYGFDKSAEALDFSHVHANRLMEVADDALRSAIAPSRNKPQSKKVRFDVGIGTLQKTCNGMYALLKQSKAMPLVGQEVDYSITRFKGDFNNRDPGKATDQAPHFDSLVMFINGAFNLGMTIRTFRPTIAGYYDLRVNGFGVMNDHGKLVPSERLETVGFYTKDRTLGFVDLPCYQPTTKSIRVWLEPEDEIIPLVASAPFSRISVGQKGKPGKKLTTPEVFTKFKAPGVAFRWLEMEGPFFEEWPPASHQALFGEYPVVTKEVPSTRRNEQPTIEVADIKTTDEPRKQASQLMWQFLNRALRRPVDGEDMKTPMRVVNQKLQRGETFLEAMISGYRSVLTSPDFLLMNAEKGKLPDPALAERLSYFLWNSAPDNTLRNFARQGKLSDPKTLRLQTERMLRDSRSDRFIEHFLDKWLKLEDIALTEPDSNLYPDYTPLLMDSSLWESRAFFREMIRADLGALYAVDSDFVMINQRLGELYGMRGVKGSRIRKVKLPDDSVRGGFLTQSAILKTTANGTVTSPVLRGDYVMTHFLGDPPPPPPPIVPAVEPDISGALSIRDQLAKHREAKACASCHAMIDPPGFALESFDVMGGFRKKYRSIEQGTLLDLTLFGKAATTRENLVVDASGEFEGSEFGGIREFRDLLLEREEQIARHLFGELISYSTGAPVGFADRPVVDNMMTSLKKKDYGLRSMIHAIVQSRLFLEK